MGIVQELKDLISQFSFYKIVHEYEQGLHYRSGRVMERRLKQLPQKDLDEIVKSENDFIESVVKDNLFLGSLYYATPFRRPKLPEGFTRTFGLGMPIDKDGDAEKEINLLRSAIVGNSTLRALYFIMHDLKKEQLPEGYRKSWLTEVPLHPKRFGKNMQPGFYFHIPLIDKIDTDSVQERLLNLGYITVTTTDSPSKNITLSCNIRYKVSNMYKAHTAIDDYEDSLQDHTLSMLAETSMGKTSEEWTKLETIQKVANEVEEKVRKIATENWGLRIMKVYVTDIIIGPVQRTVYEGINQQDQGRIVPLQPSAQ